MANREKAFIYNNKKCNFCEAMANMKLGALYACDKHYRFAKMKAEAKRKGKYVPSYEELELLSPSDMKCPICSKKMFWRKEEDLRLKATLQHWGGSRVSIICYSCNCKHGTIGEDILHIPESHKRCPKCKEVLPLISFGTTMLHGKNIVRYYCIPCKKEYDKQRYFSSKKR